MCCDTLYFWETVLNYFPYVKHSLAPHLFASTACKTVYSRKLTTFDFPCLKPLFPD